jgi:hypothetical protein
VGYVTTAYDAVFALNPERKTYVGGGLETFETAANLYRMARRRGLTIRRTVDCLIAPMRLDTGARIYHDDRDFDALKGLGSGGLSAGVRVDAASRSRPGPPHRRFRTPSMIPTVSLPWAELRTDSAEAPGRSAPDAGRPLI